MHRCAIHKSLRRITITLVAFSGILFSSADAQEKGNGSVSVNLGPFAVVELFTSEGCSSCPPAERIFIQLTETAKEQQAPVYTLAFHVDYWNALGWIDPYSQPKFTQRQKFYAYHNNSKTVYTPQIIINGATYLEGYQSQAIQDTIEQQLKKPARASIILKTSQQGEDVLLSFTVRGDLEKSFLNIALVEEGISNYVPRGENAGKTLRHENVVRDFQSFVLYKNQGDVTLTVPEGVNRAKTVVVVYLQNMEDMSVLGANKLKLPRSPSF